MQELSDKHGFTDEIEYYSILIRPQLELRYYNKNSTLHIFNDITGDYMYLGATESIDTVLELTKNLKSINI